MFLWWFTRSWLAFVYLADTGGDIELSKYFDLSMLSWEGRYFHAEDMGLALADKIGGNILIA